MGTGRPAGTHARGARAAARARGDGALSRRRRRRGSPRARAERHDPTCARVGAWRRTQADRTPPLFERLREEVRTGTGMQGNLVSAATVRGSTASSVARAPARRRMNEEEGSERSRARNVPG